MRCSTSISVWPPNSGAPPVSISPNTQPHAQMSTGELYRVLWRMSSGLMYHRVPAPAVKGGLARISRASPKSATFMTLSASMSRFSGLMSCVRVRCESHVCKRSTHTHTATAWVGGWVVGLRTRWK